MINKFTKLQAKVLSLVAWSNGLFDTKEQEFYINFLNSMKIKSETTNELLKYISTPPYKEEVLKTLKDVPRDLVLATVKNAYLMAKISDDISSDEKQILIEIGKILNLDDKNIENYFKMLEKYYESFLIEKEIF